MMGNAGMIRVLALDPSSNVGVIKVACPAHVRKIVKGVKRTQLRLSPITGETERACDYCGEDHDRPISEWPIDEPAR